MLRRMSACSLCLWLVMGTLSVYSAEVVRLTFAQLVDSLKANLEVTQKIKSYNGQEVEIQGFIIPAGPPDLSFFLLSRVSAIGNYCCELSTGQDETVYVYTAKGVHLFYAPCGVYGGLGLFEAGAYTDPANGVSLFRLRQAHVEEAVGAKIMKIEDTPAAAR